MGCDIHLFTEIKKSINSQDKWVNADNWRYNPYYQEGNDDGERMLSVESIYSGRNYELFGILAGVRDHSNDSIDDPRGLPEDVSEVTKKESDRWDGDGHSHSWLTLKELKEYQGLHPVVKREGFISPEDAELLDAGEETPDVWCEFTSVSTWVKREWEEGYDVLKPIIDEMDKRVREEFWVWGDEPKPELDEKIRIVFWFDN
jgi:hypothetical protein